MQVTHWKVFKISNVEGPVSCSFCPNPSQAYAKSLGLGKCSSHFASSELFYSRNKEHLLILLWSPGSAGHLLLLLAFIVSKWLGIPSRKKEPPFLILFPCVACCVSLQLAQMQTQVLQSACFFFKHCRNGTALFEPDSFQLYVYLL